MAWESIFATVSREMNIILGESTWLCGMRAEDTEGPISASNNDAHAAHNSMLTQQRRPAKPFFRAQVLMITGSLESKV